MRPAAALLALAILLPCAAQPAAEGSPVECWYTAREPLAEYQPHPGCADVSAGQPVLRSGHLQRMSFTRQGLAAVLISGQHYYVNLQGALLPVLAHDNGPDSYSEGLTRSPRGGKIAFFDAGFKQVVPPLYDWAWPFDTGRALVCNGCAASEPDADGHVSVTGGAWGFIDRNGNEVVPVRLSREDALKQREAPPKQQPRGGKP